MAAADAPVEPSIGRPASVAGAGRASHRDERRREHRTSQLSSCGQQQIAGSAGGIEVHCVVIGGRAGREGGSPPKLRAGKECAQRLPMSQGRRLSQCARRTPVETNVGPRCPTLPRSRPSAYVLFDFAHVRKQRLHPRLKRYYRAGPCSPSCAASPRPSSLRSRMSTNSSPCSSAIMSAASRAALRTWAALNRPMPSQR